MSYTFVHFNSGREDSDFDKLIQKETEKLKGDIMDKDVRIKSSIVIKEEKKTSLGFEIRRSHFKNKEGFVLTSFTYSGSNGDPTFHDDMGSLNREIKKIVKERLA